MSCLSRCPYFKESTFRGSSVFHLGELEQLMKHADHLHVLSIVLGMLGLMRHGPLQGVYGQTCEYPGAGFVRFNPP